MGLEDEWVPVEGFDGYSVNPLGQVRRDAVNRLLEIRFNQQGVPYVGLMRRDWDRPQAWGEIIHYPNQQHVRSLPKLVARAFLPTPSDIFDTPIQLDGDRANCRADNLMWRPRWFAVRYNQQFKERYPHPIEGPIRALEDENVFPDSLTAACFYGLLEREVVLSVHNKVPVWPTYQMFELAGRE